MIKANELKPDNLIYFTNPLNNDGKRVVVIDSVKKSIWSFQEKNDHGIDIWLPLSYCEPIPLSPEWLERCGFERVKEEDSNHYLSYSILKLDGVITKQEDGWYQMITDVDGYYEQNVGVKLEFVHQLQNRYQSFTGEELQIKMP